MQLLIILALLLYGGKSGAQNVLSEVKPILESIGGDDMKQALKSAEEISEVLSAIKDMNGTFEEKRDNGEKRGDGERRDNSERRENGERRHDDGFFESADNKCSECERKPSIAFPLAPISDIADRDITYSLSRYFSRC